jgi:hypothetical protein
MHSHLQKFPMKRREEIKNLSGLLQENFNLEHPDGEIIFL